MRYRGQLRRKKAELTGAQLVALIVILVATFVALAFLLKMKNTLQGQADGECAAAVAKAAYINKLFGREYAQDIKGCSTKSVEIKRSDYPKDPQVARKLVERTVAEQMRLCWKAWGRGEYDLFNGTGDYCHTCAVISFDGGVQELYKDTNYAIPNYAQYLATTKSPEGKTYQEVLTGYSSKNSGVSTVANAPWNVPVNKELSVLFAYSKEKSQNDVYNVIFGNDFSPSQKTAVAGAVAGTTVGVGAAGAGVAAAATTSAAASAAAAASTAAAVEAVALAQLVPAGAVVIWAPAASTAAAASAAAASTAAAVGSPYIAVFTAAANPVVLGVAATAVVGTYLYARYGGGDDYYTVSATYLIPHDKNSYYGQQCGESAAISVSP